MNQKNTNNLIEFESGDAAYKHFATLEYTYPMNMPFMMGPYEWFNATDESVYKSTYQGGPPACWAKIEEFVEQSYEGAIFLDSGVPADPASPSAEASMTNGVEASEK